MKGDPRFLARLVNEVFCTEEALAAADDAAWLDVAAQLGRQIDADGINWGRELLKRVIDKKQRKSQGGRDV